MELELIFAGDKVALRPKRPGVMARLLGGADADLIRLPKSDQALALAIGTLQEIENRRPGAIRIGADEIEMDHEAVAELDRDSAEALGLPPIVDLTLQTDVQGIVGNPDFRLSYAWTRSGRREAPTRMGAILETSRGRRRLPLWMLHALDVADAGTGTELTDQWNALAKFREALDRGVSVPDPSHAARVSMTDFLDGLEVCVTDRLSISPDDALEDFDVVPFSAERLSEEGLDPEKEQIVEANSLLDGEQLNAFQRRFRDRGALPAYRVGHGSYMVVDCAVAPALEVMAKKKHAPPEERKEFIRNPREDISNAVARGLEASGDLDGLTDAQREEAVERAAEPLLIETRQYSERVTGIITWEAPDLGPPVASGTTWLPEGLDKELAEQLRNLPPAELSAIRDEVADAIDRQEPQVDIAGRSVAPRSELVADLDNLIASKQEEAAPEDDAAATERAGPQVLSTIDNFEEIAWMPDRGPRMSPLAATLPSIITTQLKDHQVNSFDWAVEAWKAGLPGILNADEQGLGKTLQTIAFLAWLKQHMEDSEGAERGPVLVVAPTSLLENWEAEVERHTAPPGLGHLIRLYGSAISARRRTGTQGRDTDDGVEKLDLDTIHEAVAEGRAHRFWLLTTYTTLTNYQHSLARIPFSAAVFDEIQNIKNPASLRAAAVRALKADFRIGLTGTPIENSTDDLWAIMDQLAPGSLGDLKSFRAAFGSPDETALTELHRQVFHPAQGRPALALRRIKDEVAKDLPKKSRWLHPRTMPDEQARRYDEARQRLTNANRGAMLKILHHFRSVSVHPELDTATPGDAFIEASGRLSACFDVLREISRKGERALVFVESRKMQFHFAALVQHEFGLDQVDVINGSTPIPQRQKIVNRFQLHLDDDRGFDLLVLGPRAAGTGLTLTAATHVIHLSRWWNPAVEEQCNDRVHRIGQTRPVSVHLPMAIHPGYRDQSFDCLLQSLMQKKRHLASTALWPMGDTRSDVDDLQKMLKKGEVLDEGDSLTDAITKMFARDGMHAPQFNKDGSVKIPEMN